MITYVKSWIQFIKISSCFYSVICADKNQKHCQPNQILPNVTHMHYLHTGCKHFLFRRYLYYSSFSKL